MRKQFMPLAQVSFENGLIHVRGRGSNQSIVPFHILILEQFAHHNDAEHAFIDYHNVCKVFQFDLWPSDPIFTIPKPSATLLLVGNCVFVCPIGSTVEAYRLANLKNTSVRVDYNVSPNYLSKALYLANVQDLTELSRKTPVISNELLCAFLTTRVSYPVLSMTEFLSSVDFLAAAGLLTAPFGTVELGDFSRAQPLCPDYGYSRGTPIDRFYLGQFVAEIRDLVLGATLEIGGRRTNKDRYGFGRVTEYVTMDIHKHAQVDVIGDAHHSETHPPERFNSIVLFNVLEHCQEPWIVVNNLYRWLKVGGLAFCVVPNAQRVHGDPKDYWRILPDAFSSLFKRFAIIKLKTYGNLLTVHSSLSGIAAEELTPESLEANNSDYPVMTCIVAQKKDCASP
jgi:SAM-dependent methyltransferase